MKLTLPNPDGTPGVTFQGTPNEIFAIWQLLLKASKSGGEISDLDMLFLNSLVDNGKKDEGEYE